MKPWTSDALIFNGAGVNASNAQSLINIVASHGLTYEVVDSTQLNSMTAAQIANHGVLVWPGGNADDMNAALTAETRLHVRQAVQQYGVSYTGFCAGAWIAVGPDAANQTPWWGFALVTGDYLKTYYPNGQDPEGAIVPVTFSNGTVRDLVWWQGPYLPVLSNGIVGKYPDGRVAIAETWSGKGYVTISGVHPEAPQSWRDGINLVDPDGLDFDVAWDLIHAALKKTPRPAF